MQAQAPSRTVWPSPSIHTWEAWLAQRWRHAVQAGATAPLQLLGTSQERALWEQVLERLGSERAEPLSLTLHAGALMTAATRAVQSGIIPGSGGSHEETLLADALREVRAICAARGLLSLRLAEWPALDFLAESSPPLFVGQLRLTALQQSLRRRFWPATELLHRDATATETASAGTAAVTCLRGADLEQELEACAAWATRHVDADPGARLLVLSACTDPGLGIQGELLWRRLAGPRSGDDTLRRRWLAVEGGEPLDHQLLVGDALAVLQLPGADEVFVADLQRLLRSPYLEFGGATAANDLVQWLHRQGIAGFRAGVLGDALASAATKLPAAQQLLALLRADPSGTPGMRQSATAWAMQFSASLDALGFARAQSLDSREHQRFARWHQLLDEFAGLDAVLPAMTRRSAVQQLHALARRARHQAATGDAAITLSDQLGDPVVHYDGIWVLGISEQRWPAPPRPDPWVPLDAQRQAQWTEAGVAQRREQAHWALERWRRCTGDLVLSHPAHEEDVTHHAPTVPVDATWRDIAPHIDGANALGHAARDHDERLRPVSDEEREAPLAGGSSLLASQQECAFRTQARYRLGAEPPGALSDGIPAWLRGRLLHALLNDIWSRLRDQAALRALAPDAERELLVRAWDVALREVRGAQWLSPMVRERERARALLLCTKLLELERQRAPFAVMQRESAAQWQGAGARVALRIDRVDDVEGAGVLIDYKSGGATRSGLHKEVLDPVQLALYAAALLQRGERVDAAALLNLDPQRPHFSGVAAAEGLLPGKVHEVTSWEPLQSLWARELTALMAAHLSGEAVLARDVRACARCHLPALCRRSAAGADEDPEAESADE